MLPQLRKVEQVASVLDQGREVVLEEEGEEDLRGEAVEEGAAEQAVVLLEVRYGYQWIVLQSYWSVSLSESRTLLSRELE